MFTLDPLTILVLGEAARATAGRRRNTKAFMMTGGVKSLCWRAPIYTDTSTDSVMLSKERCHMFPRGISIIVAHLRYLTLKS